MLSAYGGRLPYLLLLLIVLPSFSLGQADPAPAAGFVRQYAAHYRVPPELIAALIDVESRWNPRAVSNKGAMGLMQLMPATAKRYGAFDPFNVEQNIDAGTRYPGRRNASDAAKQSEGTVSHLCAECGSKPGDGSAKGQRRKRWSSALGIDSGDAHSGEA